MTGQSFGYRNIARCLIPADFENDKALRVDGAYKNRIIEDAVVKANQTGVDPLSISSIKVKNNTAYNINNLADLLVLRRCSMNISRAFKPRMKQRNQIIRELQSFLSDGTAYRLYKLDIQSFFESINKQHLDSILKKSNVSTQTQLLALTFLKATETSYGGGLPRGIGLSSVLAEVYMQHFDARMNELDEVDYYSRFVDDIILITQSTEQKVDFLDKIMDSLPDGLVLNQKKQKILDVPVRTNGQLSATSMGDEIAAFNHLGYSVRIFDTPTNSKGKTSISRNIVTDISANKVKTLKTRVSRSFYAYAKDGDFILLVDRLKFLTTNRFFLNKKKNRLIPSGIYYSHSIIDPNSAAISELDKFLQSILLFGRGRIANTLAGKLTSTQRNELLSISFSLGFKSRKFKRYSPNRMKKIAEIYK